MQLLIFITVDFIPKLESYSLQCEWVDDNIQTRGRWKVVYGYGMMGMVFIYVWFYKVSIKLSRLFKYYGLFDIQFKQKF